ncbi:helix-turn-helix transcriptional regulator [Rhodobacteraceae bacterium NNCM2]|nr:helix-turn-helix transcriptional regulator [Coraliihabitans acroporae]
MVDPTKPSRRLTLQQAVEVWIRRSKGHLQHHIAAHFGVNQGRISEILSGKVHPEARKIAFGH